VSPYRPAPTTLRHKLLAETQETTSCGHLK